MTDSPYPAVAEAAPFGPAQQAFIHRAILVRIGNNQITHQQALTLTLGDLYR